MLGSRLNQPGSDARPWPITATICGESSPQKHRGIAAGGERRHVRDEVDRFGECTDGIGMNEEGVAAQIESLATGSPRCAAWAGARSPARGSDSIPRAMYP